MKRVFSKKEKIELGRIIAAAVMFVTLICVDKTVGLALPCKYGWLLPFGLYLCVYLFIGYDVILKAIKNILHLNMLDENFLMCVATVGAFALAIFSGATGREIEGFDEACAVLLFYQVGEFFQRYAVNRSRADIASLMDIRPDTANVMRGGETVTVSPDEVEIGERISVLPGQRVPLDGVCVRGETSLDVKALTGESLPKEIAPGDAVLSGSVNLTSTIELTVEKKFYDSTASKILELVENAADKKSKTENFITKFARIYTPTVVALALALAIIPSAITGDPSTWVYRALSFLVVSCPCALVISIPLSFFAGIGTASKEGILIKGSDFLERLEKADIFVFDKTGTLSKGSFEVTEVIPECNKERILRLAATAENGSTHPIARSIVAAANCEPDADFALTDIAGMGIMAVKGEDTILCGNAKLMEKFSVDAGVVDCAGTAVYVAYNGKYEGTIVVADCIKDEAYEVIDELNRTGKTIMLTGDSEKIAKYTSEKLKLTDYKASLLPADKVAEMEKILAEKDGKSAVCYVGDGINDAPVLTRADIGVAMGGIGSDAAIEAADIVIMQDDLRRIPVARKISKRTVRIAYENIVFSLLVKAAILVLSAIGITHMWIAVFGDVGVAVIAILNALRVRNRRAIK